VINSGSTKLAITANGIQLDREIVAGVFLLFLVASLLIIYFLISYFAYSENKFFEVDQILNIIIFSILFEFIVSLSLCASADATLIMSKDSSNSGLLVLLGIIVIPIKIVFNTLIIYISLRTTKEILKKINPIYEK
jgi:hypothetical protein